MLEIAQIIGALCLVALMAGKKKEKKMFFGQMTLSDNIALEYLKSRTEGFVRQASHLFWITPLEAQAKGYSVPTWVIENYEKFEWSVIIYDVDKTVLPLFVYQKSALQGIERFLSKMEAEGASIEQTNPRQMVVDFGDVGCEIKIWRNENGGKFASYHVEVDGQ